MQVEIHTTEMQPKPWYKALYFQVLIAIVFGVLLGHFVPEKAVQLKVLGDGFIALVKMIIAPVIFITVSTGIASMADLKTMGRITGKAFLYFMTFSTLALVIGMLVGNLIQPGAGLHIDPKSLDPKSIQEYVDATQDHNLSKFVLDIIPKSLMSSLTGDSILQVLFVSIMFGIGITLTIDKSKPVLDFLHALSHPIFKIVEILMKLAPIGAFGAMGFTVGKFGLSVLLNLAGLVGTFYLTSAFFVLVVLGAVSWYNKFNIFKLLRYIKEELVLVLGTSSSESALPNVMKKLEKAGCAKQVVGLVIPTGYSFNLDGTNIYMTLAALFIAQACDVNLPIEKQLLLLLVAMLSSKGAAGVSGAGFITLAATLAVVPDVPVVGMTLILGIDKFMSECRALTNFIGNAVATIVVANWENQLDFEKLKKALK
ncbi:dicarboxylate/amino acid:cation symporter [Flavobacterium sp. RSSB_23]|uniref:dicarboxylate/amino acid:cation symporter n=1 Tax=Flavobacterium sp. RSSB_23 TaxID=3447668 RepID=UPI003F303FBD